ncbi:MAG: hypothetical protein Q7R80_01935 [bacterium]|nr:hypothetical protein [bacterium]
MRAILAVAALAACTIDARPESEEGVEYEVTYTAPEAASSVSLCDNFDGEWRCSQAVVGRSVTWSGDLDAVRLEQSPAEGGYIVNFSFTVEPNWAVGQDGLGGFVEVGELTLSGPLPYVAEPVDNGLDGGNYWLRLSP